MLALTYWSYKDALVQSAVTPYLKMIRQSLPAGSRIFLVTLEQPHLRMNEEELRHERRKLNAENIELIALGYSRFGLWAILKWMLFLPRLLAVCLIHRISHIHAWCTPAGGAGYILSTLTGTPLVVDSYEPHADSMAELGDWRRDGLAFRILFQLEKLQSRRASAVIATTRGVKDYAEQRWRVRLGRFYVKPASVDMQLFKPDLQKDPELLREFGLEGKLVCVYAGKIGGIYLEREIFDFFQAAATHWGDDFRVLLLTNTDEKRVRELALASGVDPANVISRFVPFAEVPRHLGLGDFAINPVRPIPTKKYCTSLKDGEYWAMGLPVVIPQDISDDSDIIWEYGIGAVINEFTPEGYKKAVLEIDEILKKNSRAEIIARIRSVAAECRDLAHTEYIYKELYS